MLTRLALDIVAVAASTMATLLASIQVEDGALPRAVLWLSGAILVVVVCAETYDLWRLGT